MACFYMYFAFGRVYTVYRSKIDEPNLLNVATFINSVKDPQFRQVLMEAIKKASQNDYDKIESLIKPLTRPVVSPREFFRKT